MFSVSAPTMEIVSAPPELYRGTPPSLHFQAAVGARAHIPEGIKSPPPPSDFPASEIIFACRSTSLFYSPLLFLASKLFHQYLSTLGGGEAVSYFKKAVHNCRLPS